MHFCRRSRSTRRCAARSTRISAAPATSPRSPPFRKTTQAHAVLVARQAGVIAGLPLAVATFQKLSPDIVHPPRMSVTASAVAAGINLLTHLRPGARGADRRAHRAEFRRPALRHRHADRGLRAPHRRHQAADLLHAQDHARAARAGEIRGALRRRLQPSLRARRRGADQGQPHRGGRRHPPGAGARARRGSAIWSRSRSRSTRSISCARCSTPAWPTSCCSTTWTSRR